MSWRALESASQYRSKFWTFGACMALARSVLSAGGFPSPLSEAHASDEGGLGAHTRCGVEQWQLGRLITLRSEVRSLPPLYSEPARAISRPEPSASAGACSSSGAGKQHIPRSTNGARACNSRKSRVDER